MQHLKGSVGEGGKNNPLDVAIVQQLINKNRYLMPNVKKLTVDKRIGDKTIRAIKFYQLNVVKMPIPDGRIDPHGRTFRRLLDNARKLRPANVDTFIKSHLAAAKAVNVKYHVPVSIILAQAALESGWGVSVKDNAYFGVKAHSTTGKTTAFTTTEYINGKKTTLTDSFRAYANFKESAMDYGKFLTSNPIYKQAFNYIHDADKFAEELQKAGYATDPNYAKKLKTIISVYYLNVYDH